MIKVLIILMFSNFLYSECSDLDFDECMQWPDYCEWDEELGQCQDIGGGSGGGGDKFFRSMKTQLEHVGSIVMPRCIAVNNSSPLKKDSAKKILKQFINLI